MSVFLKKHGIGFGEHVFGIDRAAVLGRPSGTQTHVVPDPAINRRACHMSLWDPFPRPRFPVTPKINARLVGRRSLIGPAIAPVLSPKQGKLHVR
jgi:hypothetical protein